MCSLTHKDEDEVRFHNGEDSEQPVLTADGFANQNLMGEILPS
jgi:hypothetical protein